MKLTQAIKTYVPPKWLVIAAVLFALSNFVVFFVISSKLGGEASSGYQAGEHYFLSFGKGTFVEVSKLIFEYSWWHENIVYTLWVLALAILGWRNWRTRSTTEINR